MKYIPDVLYGQILQVMPVPCVDIIVRNPKSEILLLKRKNMPAKDQWWFPGGRVQFMETRMDAVLRKLLEECGLKGKVDREIGTFDLILDEQSSSASHGITTVYQVSVDHSEVRLDSQSEEFCWKSCKDWIHIVKSPFVSTVLQSYYVEDARK